MKYKSIAQFYSKNPDLWTQGTLMDQDGRRCLAGAGALIYGAGTFCDMARKLNPEGFSVLYLNDKMCENVWDALNVCYAFDL